MISIERRLSSWLRAKGDARVLVRIAGVAALVAGAYWLVESYAHARYARAPFAEYFITKDVYLLGERLVFLAIMVAFSGYCVAVALRARREAERGEREDEIRRAAIMENIQEMILLHDSNLNALWANKASGDSIAMRPEEIVGRHCYELWHGRTEPCVVCPVLRAMKTGVPQEDDVYTPDGRVFFIRGYPVRGDDGTVVGAVEVTLDITARKRVEDELAREKERLAVTLASIGDGVVVADTKGAITFMNKAAETLSGWRGAEAIGRPLDDVFKIADERTKKPRKSPLAEVLRTGMPAVLPAGTVLIARNGVERFIADSGAPIRNPDGEIVGMVLVFRDVTEKRRLEQEILKSQKLESLGVLAGGIAHDFNNILTAIIGHASLARLSMSAQDKAYEVLGDIEKAAARARSLTQQLLTFSKGGAPIKKITSLNDVIKDTVRFALSGSNVSGVFELSGELWPVDVDAEQVSHAINNIVINAREAMPQGGRIAIRTENAEIPGDAAFSVPPGTYVKISIRDEGVGIAREDLSRIFDPYFTTKEEHHSGLGLAVAYFVVRKHNGHILVDSEPDVATVFSIYLPAAKAPEPRGPEPVEELHSFEGHGRILIMDDEEIVRDVLGKILERFGYEHAFARHGMEAIDKYREAMESGRPFDAVIMDLTVTGGMGGREAIELLRLVDPTVTAIVSSGYSGDALMSEYRAYGFDGVIAKPYRADELSMTLAKALREKKVRH
jgi:PAS domain S-box-containing protein